MKKNILIVLLSSLLLLICGCEAKEDYVENTEIEETTCTVSVKEETINDSSPLDAPPKIDKHKTDEDKTNNDFNTNNDANINNNVNTEKKTIVIDPGHGGPSNLEKEQQSPDSNIMKIKDGGGCQGVVTGVREAVVTLQVSMKLKPLLEAKGFNVIMTRVDDSKSMGNIERAEIGNNNNANLVIRIHCDSADSSSANGATMLVPGKVGYANNISDISAEYGKKILNTLTSTVGMKNRGITVSQDMTGFNWSKVPVVLIEMGFMSNANEDRLLTSDSYQNKLAQGLCDGISGVFNN